MVVIKSVSVLQSLSVRNKQLLNEKKALLIQNKVEFDRLEKQKVNKHWDLSYLNSTFFCLHFLTMEIAVYVIVR